MLLLASSRASAELAIVDSIEWMVADSDLVVRARVASVEDDPDGVASDAYARPQRVTFAVVETMKGAPTADVAVRVYRNSGAGEDIERWRAEGNDDRVVFFGSKHSQYASAVRGVKQYEFCLREGAWQPPRGGRPRVEPYVIRMDQRVVRGREAIEEAVRMAAREERVATPAPGELVPVPAQLGPPFLPMNRPTDGAIALEIDYGSPAHALVWSGSAASLVVPLDKRIEAIAAAWLDHRSVRTEEAIRVLRHFRNPANVGRLRAALRSPFWSTGNSAGPGMRWSLPWRAAAHDALHAWGVDVPRPAIEMPADGYRPVTRRAAIAVVAVAVAGFVAIVLAAHRLRRRSSLRAAMIDAACVALLALVAFIWWIDGRRAGISPELAFHSGTTRGWAWMHASGLTVVRATAWDATDTLGTTLAVAAFDVASVSPQRWREPAAATTSRDFAGFRYVDGTLQSANGAPSPATSLRVPLWFVAALAAALPVARVAAIAFRANRRHRRSTRGQCLACGYDLRGGAGDRCPECGTASAAAPRGSMA